jgi:hypothetical protein
MKTRNILMISAILISLFTGCTTQGTPSQTQQTTLTTSNTTASVEATSSASIVNTADAFQKAISSNGTWIIAITKDLTIDKDISLDGEYKNGKKDTNGKDIIQRKLALYSQDANRNITARYTLTAPKFTINSPEASIQHGTFKGDLYVNVKNFKLIDATVDGNVYFMTDEAKTTFNADAKSKVTGKQELKK